MVLPCPAPYAATHLSLTLVRSARSSLRIGPPTPGGYGSPGGVRGVRRPANCCSVRNDEKPCDSRPIVAGPVPRESGRGEKPRRPSTARNMIENRNGGTHAIAREVVNACGGICPRHPCGGCGNGHRTPRARRVHRTGGGDGEWCSRPGARPLARRRSYARERDVEPLTRWWERTGVVSLRLRSRVNRLHARW